MPKYLIFFFTFLGTETDMNIAEKNKNIMTEKIYRQHSEHNTTTEWFEGYEQNIASDLWLFLYFTILLLFVGFIGWLYFKISAISKGNSFSKLT